MYKSLHLHPRRKKRQARPEQTMQIGLFTHLTPKMVYQRFEKFFAYAIPNGGHRTKAEAGIFKAMGVFAGAGDTLVHLPPEKGSIWGRTIYIEIKIKSLKLNKKTGKAKLVYTYQTPTQERFEQIVTHLGIPYHVIEASDINDLVNQYLEILKGYGVT